MYRAIWLSATFLSKDHVVHAPTIHTLTVSIAYKSAPKALLRMVYAKMPFSAQHFRYSMAHHAIACKIITIFLGSANNAHREQCTTAISVHNQVSVALRMPSSTNLPTNVSATITTTIFLEYASNVLQAANGTVINVTRLAILAQPIPT